MRTNFRRLLGTTTALPHYLFRVILSLVTAYFIIKDDRLNLFNFSITTSIWLFISALTIYLLLLIVDQLSIFLDFQFPWHLQWRQRLILQIVGGIFLPVLPGFLGLVIYFQYHDIELMELLYFIGYFEKIGIALAIFNVKFLLTRTPQQLLEKLLNLNVAPIFEPGCATNYKDIAYIFKECGQHLAANFTNDLMIWPEPVADSKPKLPNDDFYFFNEDMIINKRAIATVQMDNQSTTILLLNGLQMTHVFDEQGYKDFQQWLENESATIPLINDVLIDNCSSSTKNLARLIGTKNLIA